MSQRTRILIAGLIVVALVGVVLGVELLRRQAFTDELEPGSIPIYVRGKLIAAFLPTDLEQLTEVSFVDAEEGKTQQGWMLRDVLLLYLTPDALLNSDITVGSSSRGKTITLSWAEVDAVENMVMFDLAGRGTLKLVSKIPGFDIRDAWVQDVDRIDVER
ncbi:MAG TPA: hypothetical protein PKH77_27010 [Anaerolineae bacterium]|nr:hypothetical protein [Anaerolineae bacterium]